MTMIETQVQQRNAFPTHRVLIADDHGLVRETIAAFIMNTTPYAVETVGTFEEAVEACAQRPYDLALLDLDMPGMEQDNPLQTLQTFNVDMAIAIISATEEPGNMQEAFANGARGYIPKSMPLRSLVPVLNLMLSGETFVPRRALDPLLNAPAPEVETDNPLKPIDIATLRMVQDGKSNKEIAIMRDGTENQVKTWLRVIFRRIGAKNRTHAVDIARRNQWI